MRENPSARSLLRAAARIYDAPENRLAEFAARAWRGGFASGGEWMRTALGVLRHQRPNEIAVDFSKLGLIKYGLASSAALLFVVAAALTQQAWWLLIAVPLFYAVEAQMVFLFPLALDGASRLFSECRDWTRLAGGTRRVMTIVMGIAARMIFGGFAGRGFVRSWSIGCLAVLIWYERLRTGLQPEIRPLLEVGPALPLLTRMQAVSIFGNAEPVRLLYASDLHCNGGNSRRAIGQLIEAVRLSRADAIVLGGDLADTRSGLVLLEEAVKHLSACAPVWAIAGNHDRALGLAEVRAAVERSGGNWLGDRSAQLPSRGRKPFHLDGAIREDTATGRDRILCAHDPDIFPRAAALGYPLVLAGHLHGGQWVLAERRGRLFPGAWFYRWNGTQFRLGQSTLLVSRGVSDTLPVRWNCPREVLLCELY